MGACCGARGTVGNREADLAPPKITGNVYQKFELSFPFSRTYAETYAKRVQAAAAKDKRENKGDGSTVTLEALRAVFTSEAWAELKQDDSRITKLIKSPVFRNTKGLIDANWLILFGFLNCPGDIEYKSEALYSVMQEGGHNKQPYLSAKDKDISPVLTKLVHLCTLELIQLMQEVDLDPIEELAEADEIEYAVDDIFEWNYIDPLFRNDSKLSYEDWITRTKEVKQVSLIWYYPQQLRSLAFARVSASFPEA